MYDTVTGRCQLGSVECPDDLHHVEFILDPVLAFTEEVFVMFLLAPAADWEAAAHEHQNKQAAAVFLVHAAHYRHLLPFLQTLRKLRMHFLLLFRSLGAVKNIYIDRFCEE